MLLMRRNLSESDIDVEIPVSVFADDFICAICFGDQQDSYMTPCGHSFCYECIEEWLTRSHTCPHCKAEVTRPSLVKNYTLDNLQRKIKAAKEAKLGSYFEKVVRGGEGSGVSLNPIEAVFQKHMKKCFLGFTMMQKELGRQHAIRLGEISKLSDEDESVKKEKEAACVRSHEESMEKLVGEYDKYMGAFAPSPLVLPLLVQLQLRGREGIICETTIKASDCLTDLVSRLSSYMDSLGDAIVEEPKDLVFSVTLSGEEEGKEIILDKPDVPLFGQLPENCFLPGLRFTLESAVVLHSDRPKRCFVKEFVKDSGQKMDYYRCDTCRLNWVCKVCATEAPCHAGHAIRKTVSDHVPSYACCYCAKKRKCKIGDVV